MEHQLVMQFPPLFDGIGSSRQVIGVSLARGTQDFSDSDLWMLDAVTPALTSTLERLHYLALIHAAVDMAREGETLILVDADRIVTWVTPNVRQQFGISPGSPLPAAFMASVIEWSGRHREPCNDAATAILQDPPVRVRFVAGAYPGLDALYMTRHRRPGRAGLMRWLGVTARQADVLLLLIQGCTTSEIADQLAVSRRTVDSHLDGIYRRLGVKNRGQALLAAIDQDEL